jgi:hypothetical protein
VRPIRCSDRSGCVLRSTRPGTLPAWQQAALDKKIATAKALNKQALGANVDSSSLGPDRSRNRYPGHDRSGQLLQANLATGQNAYKQGTDLQAQGGRITKAAYDKAVSDVNQNLQNAINTTLTGLGPLQRNSDRDRRQHCADRAASGALWRARQVLERRQCLAVRE